ncbi:MAG: YbjQ family protein [Gemmatimonadales bacterium]
MPTPLANPNKIQHHLTTTALQLDGYRVVENYGVVLGITVRSRSILGFIGASLETLRGGRITRFVELCERTRSEAFELMLEHAEQFGANAVIAIKYDATEVMQGVTEVLCYGTAVFVEATS